MLIYSGFIHWTWWFSIVMLVYQRVGPDSRFDLTPRRNSHQNECLVWKTVTNNQRGLCMCRRKWAFQKIDFSHRHVLGTWPNIWAQTHHFLRWNGWRFYGFQPSAMVTMVTMGSPLTSRRSLTYSEKVMGDKAPCHRSPDSNQLWLCQRSYWKWP